jgi:uncharacterized protein
MKILIDITHPAHVHFFKNAARIWQYRGHEVKFVSRDKEITIQLLDELGIPHQALSKIRQGLLGLSFELIEHQSKLFAIAKRFQPDVMLNIGGTFIVHAGKLLGIKTCVFTDTEHAKLANSLTFPFANWIITPDCFLGELGKKQVRYKGYQELAYLHPNYFTPNMEVLFEHGLKPDEKFFIIRFISWGAAHDLGQQGFSGKDKINLVHQLENYGRVIITSEGPLPKILESNKIKISPTKIHDLLYYAFMYIGEGATMASEAAILGTPSVYINPLLSGNLNELIDDYHLIYHFSEGGTALKFVLDLADKKNLLTIHKRRQQQLLIDKDDVTVWLVNFIEERF